MYSAPFNPFGSPYMGFQSPVQMPAQQAQNALPPQQVMQANGKASIDALRLSPNSSVLVMDTTEPIVWLCSSDSIGTVTAKAYDISEHHDAPPVDVHTIEERLSAVEKRIEEVMNHAEPDARTTEHVETGGAL